MRVLLQIERFKAEYGGAERYAVDLARRLVEAGVEVHVAAESFGECPKGIQTHRITPFPFPKGLRVADFGRRCALLSQGFDVTHGFVKTWAVDVLHPHTGSHRASLEGLLESQESPFRRCGAKMAQAFSMKQAVFRWIERRQYQGGGVKRFLAVSRMVAEDMKVRYGVPADRIRVLYNPVDPTRFAPGSLEDRHRVLPRHGIDPSEYVCLFVGHHFRLKGLGVLFRALARLGESSPKLLILGRGNRKVFEGKARSMGLSDRVVFAGETAEPELYYRSADVFALPTYYDPCSLTVLEAMASGLPVITTSRNGAAELIQDGREGTVLPEPGRDDLLAESLRALTDPTKRAEMGRYGRERALTLDPHEHVQEILRIYEDLSPSSPRKGARKSPSPDLESEPRKHET
ncbi:MAG: glycosyltransferase family 4 protein [Planctomycetota bacterium]|jgi:UDP-glucose:(heptosyl)LPS alpha-1,3-glucosyltransferase